MYGKGKCGDPDAVEMGVRKRELSESKESNSVMVAPRKHQQPLPWDSPRISLYPQR